MTTIRSIFLAAAILAAPYAFGQWCSGANLIEQPFPSSGPEETRWRLCWRWENGPGLVISHAFFRTAPNAPWVRVLWEARLSQLFVPYHSGSPRYLDVSYGFGAVPLAAKDCPASVGGTVLGRARELCKQVKDRGLAWKVDTQVRRGEELLLWSVLDAANYNYVIEWAFRDDGMLIGRVGATAVNLPSKPYETHTHDPIWRLDLDLNGPCCDAAMQVSHAEVGATGVDTMTNITPEKGIVWDAPAYTAVHVVDQFLKNARNNQSGFHLMPVRYGTPRHQEPWTKYDFWITRYRWNEIWGNLLDTYVANGENTQNADIVVWYSGSVHHIFRDEDGFKNGSVWEGSALLMSTEFQLKPMNLFSKTPLFP